MFFYIFFLFFLLYGYVFAEKNRNQTARKVHPLTKQFYTLKGVKQVFQRDKPMAVYAFTSLFFFLK